MISARPRRCRVLTLLATTAAASVLAVGCSSSSSSGHGGNDGDTHPSATHSSATQSSDSSRETAETRLGEIGTQLATVLADYRAGKKTPAYNLAKSVSNNLYEGTTEGIVSSIDPAVERQIDSLLAATLPAAIRNGESVSQVAVLVHRAQALAASGLAAIHKSED